MGTSYKFSGGKKLEEELKRIAAKVSRKAVLNVGFPKGAREINGQSTAMIAFINEFGRTVKVKHPSKEVSGTYFQLPRPFFRNMIAKESPHWGQDLGELLKSTKYDIVAAFNLLGEQIAGELKQSIQDLVSPPLAKSTIKHKKGVTKPLIDTKVMWKSVTYWVDEEEKE